ncbi:MAG: AAA family ATPase [Ignavibacteriales bacterium]|nr:AAA family ATPase [Ignavibacteriales bacterium]
MANLSNEQIHEIRTRLVELKKNNPQYSDRVIGKNIGYSGGYVNLFLQNKFPSPSTEGEFAEKAINFLNTELTRTRDNVTKEHLKFAPTNASQKIFKIVNYCIATGKLGLIIGDNGFGKTISLREYCKKNTTSIMIEVLPIATPKSTLDDIASRLRIQSCYSRAETFDSIILRLQDTARVLIIDEAEYLNTASLEIIRRIHDFTNIPMILSGKSILQKKLLGPRGKLQQLSSRIGIQEEIKGFDLNDIRSVLSLNFPEAVKFSSTFLQLSKQNGRLLEHLISLVKSTMNETGEQLSDDLIDDAACSLLT